MVHPTMLSVIEVTLTAASTASLSNAEKGCWGYIWPKWVWGTRTIRKYEDPEEVG